MKQLATAIAVGLAVVGGAGCESVTSDGAGDEPSRQEETVVSWVVDGDTVRLRDGRVVRLLQIDAPEARTECYGRDATRALIMLAPKGTAVRLARDPRLDEHDTYDRLLRYVFVGAANVNRELVARGAAAPYFFRNERGRYAVGLLRAATKARRDRVGLWGACPSARLEPGLGSVTGPASTQRR